MHNPFLQFGEFENFHENQHIVIIKLSIVNRNGKLINNNNNYNKKQIKKHLYILYLELLILIKFGKEKLNYLEKFLINYDF